MCNVSLRASGGSVGLPDAVSWGKVLGVWELRGDFCYICAGAGTRCALVGERIPVDAGEG